MNRKQMIEYIKREICPQLHIKQELDIVATIKAIERYRVVNHVKPDEPMKATVNEFGHLFINGQHAGQITNKIPQPNFYEDGYIIESRILARQGL